MVAILNCIWPLLLCIYRGFKKLTFFKKTVYVVVVFQFYGKYLLGFFPHKVKKHVNIYTIS